jgi:hypothetical protein
MLTKDESVSLRSHHPHPTMYHTKLKKKLCAKAASISATVISTHIMVCLSKSKQATCSLHVDFTDMEDFPKWSVCVRVGE